MPLRRAQSQEGQLWLNKFNEDLAAWLEGQRQDGRYILGSLVSLRSALEREPELAETVSLLCATILHQHSDMLPAYLIERLGKLGLEAEQMRADAHPMRWAERAMLKLALARAASAQNRNIEALDRVRSVTLPDVTSQLRRYFEARVDDEFATLHDAGLAYSLALKHSNAAVAACDQLVARDNIIALVDETIRLFFDDTQTSEDLFRLYLQLVWRDLARMAAVNSVRAARCAILEGTLSITEVETLTQRALHHLSTFGPSTVDPLDLVPLFRNVSEERSIEIIEAVCNAVEQVQIDAAPFRIVLSAAAAAYGTSILPDSWSRIGSTQDVEDSLLQTTALGLRLVASYRGGTATSEQGEEFTTSLRRLVSNGSLSLRARTQFDAPVCALLDDRVRRNVSDPESVDHRIRLAWLLDSLRTAPRPSLEWLALLPSSSEGPVPLREAMYQANDLFGRLIFALASWPKSAVIILQTDGEKTLFVCVSDRGLDFYKSDGEFQTAARKAAEVLEEQAELYFDLQVPPDDNVIWQAGTEAFEALPSGVRRLIEDSDTLLLCPDFRAEADSIPFEVFVCRKQFLGISKVISRVSSVEAAVRVAEGTRRRVTEQRALSIGITSATEERLASAAEEAEAVRVILAASGWDAPIIQESRVSVDYIVNRTPFAAHLHIAAHGANGGGQEAVLLPNGGLLTSEDVLLRSFGCTPTVWLNTCDLAQARYAGGGAIRGVAQAFLEAGSPAVIASLLKVEDKTSAFLASRFYTNCAQHSFGEALRLSRADLLKSGASPVLWAPTVLMGDPRATLEPVQTPLPKWQEALVFAIAEHDNLVALTKLSRDLRKAAKSAPGDIRVACAAGLVSGLHKMAAKGESEDLSLLADVLRTCLQIHTLDGAALVAFLLSELTENEETTFSLMVTEGAITLLRPLEATDERWQQFTDKSLVRKEQISRGDRAIRLEKIGGSEYSDEAKTEAMFGAFAEARMAVDLRNKWYGLSPAPRTEEITVEDILWNAVMATRTKSFEDMPETFAYCKQIAHKLASLDAIPLNRISLAATMLAGLLKWQWDSQNTLAVEQEFIEGQAATASLALASFLTHWQEGAPWMEVVSGYDAAIQSYLRTTENLDYEKELYPAIEQAIDLIEVDGTARLEQIREEFPERVPDAMLFLLGTLVKINTYSYLDGSVPEHICEKLNDVYSRFSRNAFDTLVPWIKEAFEPASKRQLDELRRWRFGITPTTDIS